MKPADWQALHGKYGSDVCLTCFIPPVRRLFDEVCGRRRTTRRFALGSDILRGRESLCTPGTPCESRLPNSKKGAVPLVFFPDVDAYT